MFIIKTLIIRCIMSVNFESRLNDFGAYLASDGFNAEEAATRFRLLDQETTRPGTNLTEFAIQQLATYRLMFNDSIIETVPADPFVPKTECPLSGETIAADDFITIGGQTFNANFLMRSILSQITVQNPMNRLPLSEADLQKLCSHFGINPVDFRQLWRLSSADLESELASRALINGNNEEAQLALLEGQDRDGENNNFKIESRNNRFLGLLRECSKPEKLVAYVESFEFNRELLARFDMTPRQVPARRQAPAPIPAPQPVVVDLIQPRAQNDHSMKMILCIAMAAIALYIMHYYKT